MRIDDMKPGPEMDRLIAKAFGWEYKELALGQIIAIFKLPDGRWCNTKFSTTWSGMRLVVEEMQRRGWWLYVDQRSDTEYNVRFWHTAKGIWSEFVLAGPLPYATILAAIKALQGEDIQP
jgi:hypothetical protein